jgi:hypothetical protein
MARPRLIFVRTYNHRWPSRAVTEYKASATPTLVPKEVHDAALKGKFARLATKADGHDGTDQAAGDLARPDSGKGGASKLGDGDGLLAGGAGDGAASSTES